MVVVVPGSSVGSISTKHYLIFDMCYIGYNGSRSKNPDIKMPLVVSFSLGVVIHFSPLAAF